MKAGKHFAVKGEYLHHNRHLTVQFSYNRTFGKAEYPKGGSWTKQMRPDYTLSLWPADFGQNEAEQQELIVHIHFDAKYKVQDLQYFIYDIELINESWIEGKVWDISQLDEYKKTKKARPFSVSLAELMHSAII